MRVREYFDGLMSRTMEAFAIAKRARKKGFDPSEDVEVAIAKDIGERVEGLLGIRGIKEEISRMEKRGIERDRIAFEIAKKIARGELLKGSLEERVDKSIRVGVAILTEGVLVAPTEGIASIKIDKKGKYLSVYYAGPIRSAGGTAAALSVLLADVVRREVGLNPFKPSEKEVDRIVEEINIYDARAARLQYKPPEEHVRIIYENLPVDVNGEPTEDIEVEVNRNLPRIPTNKLRGGIPLVLCEGIAQKASKLIKYVKKFNVEGWDWLNKVIKVKKTEEKVDIKPDDRYLEGMVAGRPVFSYPSEKGGFRLRYGRSFNNSIMAKNVHPATMVLLDSFIAFGTHVKVERPGKGAVLTGNENIEPPVVKLKDGSVVKVRSVEEAEKIKQDVEEILFLGDILTTYGDFRKSNHPLVPAGYCHEWWLLEAKKFGLNAKPPIEEMIDWAKKGVPLHPDYIFFWKDITTSQLSSLISYLESGKIQENYIELPMHPAKRVLEMLLVEHKVRGNKVIIEGDTAKALLINLGYDGTFNRIKEVMKEGGSTLSIVNKASGYIIRDKVGTYIGVRMGRPEKAKERAMKGSPNVLFPTGRTMRSLTKLYSILKEREKQPFVILDVARYRCLKCKSYTPYPRCHICGGKAVPVKKCIVCGKETTLDVHCGKPTVTHGEMKINFVKLYDDVRQKLSFSPSNEIKGVEGLMSRDKIPEMLEKGFLRAKYGLTVFRDGTVRFDATDVPLTHFIPKDIGVSVKKLRELGYDVDAFGNELKDENQIVALKHQDIIISERAANYFVKVANFIDDELVSIYGLEPFYNVKTKEDLIGHLVIGLAPHISTGVVGRIIGFTKANVGYAHPYFHTAKRRNADGDEDSIMLLMDALLNFSKSYLASTRGGTMDAPIVLTVNIDPKEVDDEVHEVEIEPYDLDFYNATLEFKMPNEVNIKVIGDVLDSEDVFKPFLLTHPSSSIHKGPLRTKYVTLKSIPEKVRAEIAVMDKIRAVNMRDAVSRMILSHFIPDIYGNLRRFSRQSFRCKKCNTIHRRVPLTGKCIKCGGELILTIHRGGIEKYIDISLELTEKYGLPDYLKQRLKLVKKEIESMFEDDHTKQKALLSFL